MKIFFTILGILFVYAGSAQTANQKVVQTKNLDAYAGTWEYATATDTFQVVIKKGIESRTFNYSECLIGGYRYVKNGVVVGDYTQGPIPSVFLQKDFKTTDKTITVLGSNAKNNPDWIDPNSIYIFFKDMGLDKTTQEAFMHLLSPTQIRWTLKESRGVYATLEEMPPIGFSVPIDVIMNKVIPSPPTPLPPLPPPGPGGGGNDELLPPL
jgi:hypothetical protein